MKGDVGELTAERCAIDREADTVEPLVHLGAVLTYALADNVQRDLEIGEWATGDTGEDGEDVVARKLVTPEVEALACEAAWVLEEANGDGPDVRDGDLRELSRRRLRRGGHTGNALNRALSISMAQRTASITPRNSITTASPEYALPPSVMHGVGSIRSPRSARNRAGARSSAAPALCYDLFPGLGGETGSIRPWRRPK